MINVEQFMEQLIAKNPNEPEFHQAVKEVITSLVPFVNKHHKYEKYKVLERMVEPERVIMFRVPWVDDSGEIRINKGYRVQMNSAIGPYKGGLRFHHSVNLSVLKFLAFEQVFKNSLTTLPMGGGKGGSDFDPKGKSDAEVMRFCQSFMLELFRHVDQDTDVPAGDIGVGGREIGYLYGMYKKIKNQFSSVLTGKGLNWGGSNIRPEATGYGCVYFTEEMLKTRNESLKGKTVAISGSGNVAQFASEKVIQLGGKVITMSDSNGTIYDKEGINENKLAFIMDVKNNHRARISKYAENFKGVEYWDKHKPWAAKCDIAIPCATQNEISGADAKTLIKNGCFCVAEGANMPSAPEAVDVFHENKILFAPGKASNAGGVATSGLEMSQNAIRLSWTREEVDQRLKLIMNSIHASCEKYGKEENGYINYLNGANIAGFVKVADAMIDQGIV